MAFRDIAEKEKIVVEPSEIQEQLDVLAVQVIDDLLLWRTLQHVELFHAFVREGRKGHENIVCMTYCCNISRSSQAKQKGETPPDAARAKDEIENVLLRRKVGNTVALFT